MNALAEAKAREAVLEKALLVFDAIKQAMPRGTGSEEFLAVMAHVVGMLLKHAGVNKREWLEDCLDEAEL